MKRNITYIFVGLIILFFSFVSCANFNSDYNQAQITIQLPSSSRNMVDQKDLIDHYKLQLLKFPDKYAELADLMYIQGKAILDHPLFNEFYDYLHSVDENKDLIESTHTKTETIQKKLESGIWYIRLYAFSDKNEPLYCGNNFINLKPSDKQNVIISMVDVKIKLVFTFDAGISSSFPSGFTYSKYKLPNSVYCYEWDNPNYSEDLVDILNTIGYSSSLQVAHYELQEDQMHNSFKSTNSSFPESENIENLVNAELPFIDDDNYLHLYTSIPD